MNLMMLLEMAAGAYGDRVAFQNAEDRLTYQQLYDAAGVMAASLDDGRTQHLAMLDVSTLAMPIALFGASWAGINDSSGSVPVSGWRPCRRWRSISRRRAIVAMKVASEALAGSKRPALCQRSMNTS